MLINFRTDTKIKEFETKQRKQVVHNITLAVLLSLTHCPDHGWNIFHTLQKYSSKSKYIFYCTESTEISILAVYKKKKIILEITHLGENL